MFFTTYQFIFLFLPIALVGYYALRQSRYSPFAVYWLILMSGLFYWSLDRQHLPTLVASVLVNYGLALRMESLKRARSPWAKRLLWLGLGFNAAFLGLFKYGLPAAGFDLPVPLGLSFFTLLQIGYQIAIYTETAQNLSPSRFVLMVGYFPYVVAGPLITKRDFRAEVFSGQAPFDTSLFISGLALFTLGLFKKVVLADSVAAEVGAAFSTVASGVDLSTREAWAGATLYTLQLYFDFSGYSDMACGVSAMLGMRLPRNFHSPLKAHSIMEYWRRWHMTVTKFFTNNLYLLVTLNLTRIANRRKLGSKARFALTVFSPMMICFALIGVWHGSGANFFWFGLLMAVALSVNHLWVKANLPAPARPIGWALTMLVVVSGMILDKTGSLAEALSVFKSMVGFGNPDSLVQTESAVMLKLFGLAGIALFLPNTHQILSAYQPVLPEAWDDKEGVPKHLTWEISKAGMVAMSLVLVCGLVAIPRASEFIYYRF